MCRSRIRAQAAPCTLLLMCSPAGNVLESSAVVAVAALRTWLGAGAGCCVGVLFPHRCYGACKSFSRRQSRARLLMCSQLLSLFHLENNQVKTGYKATLFPRSLFCVAQRVRAGMSWDSPGACSLMPSLTSRKIDLMFFSCSLQLVLQ